MFDDDLPQKSQTKEFPRNIENMSVTELGEYIAELELEISRVKLDMEKKKESHTAADSFFK